MTMFHFGQVLLKLLYIIVSVAFMLCQGKLNLAQDIYKFQGKRILMHLMIDGEFSSSMEGTNVCRRASLQGRAPKTSAVSSVTGDKDFHTILFITQAWFLMHRECAVSMTSSWLLSQRIRNRVLVLHGDVESTREALSSGCSRAARVNKDI